jgi:hypothetical protein
LIYISPDGNDSLVKQKASFCRCGKATLEALAMPYKNRFLQTSPESFRDGQLDQLQIKNTYFTFIIFTFCCIFAL